MHISSTALATESSPSSPGKSMVVPPGLANRGLDLPPGIAKKLAAGGTAPPGIAKRFPAATVKTSDTTETQTGGVTPPADTSSQDSTPSVDLLV
jgi:hypothetical protein